MKCDKCGKDLPPDAAFCAYCGEAVPRASPPDEPDKELRRPRSGRVFGGVVAGMSDYFGIPLTPFRIGWVAVTLLSFGFVAVIYVVLCFVIPEGAAE